MNNAWFRVKKLLSFSHRLGSLVSSLSFFAIRQQKQGLSIGRDENGGQNCKRQEKFDKLWEFIDLEFKTLIFLAGINRRISQARVG